MYELKLKTMNQGKQLTLETMLEQLKAAPQGKPFFITFTPVGTLKLPLIKQLLLKLPPECEGLDLATLIGTAKPLEIIQEVCALLPRLKRLRAEIILPEKPSAPLINSFIVALPKTEYLSLARNYLYYAPDEVFKELRGVRVLDISGNQWHLRRSQDPFSFLKKLSENTTALYIDLEPVNDENTRLTMRKNFFNNLPAHVDTLGLNVNHFYQSLPDLIWMNPSVTTLKWIKHEEITLPAHLESTPYSIKTLDLSSWELGKKSYTAEVDAALAKIPNHVTTLILDDNDFHNWPQENFVAFVSQISDHIEHIHLKRNRLFVGKSVEVRTSLLKALEPYNANGRLILEDNDYAPEPPINKITPQQPKPSNDNSGGSDVSSQLMKWLGNCTLTPSQEPSEISKLNPN